MIFLAALIANGWFLGTKAFLYSPGTDEVPRRFARAFKRWFLFIAFWVGALIFLPTLAVVSGFVCWLAWIARDIRRTLHRMENYQEEIGSNQ